jgi:hypothetical protein
MKKTEYLLKSFLSAAGVLVYVAAVAWLSFNSQRIFGNGKPDNFLAPLFVLLLFVISASVTGLLVLGKPIHLYLNNFKKEALVLLSATLGWLGLFLIVVVAALLSR